MSWRKYVHFKCYNLSPLFRYTAENSAGWYHRSDPIIICAGYEEGVWDGGQGGAGDLHQPQVRPTRQSETTAQSHFLEQA